MTERRTDDRRQGRGRRDADRAPAFQLYAQDLLSDANVMAMALDELGAYMKLLAIVWNERGVLNPSDDPDRFARMLGCPRDDFDRIWGAISRCFYTDDVGRVQHQRLDKERKQQAAWRKRAQLGGLAKAAKQRASRQEADDRQCSEPAQVCTSSSSSSSSSTSEDQEQKKDISSEPPRTAPSEPEDDSPSVLIFPTIGLDGAEWHLRQRLVTELEGLFPGLDVVGGARTALAWVRASPTRRKTGRGMRKFLTGWLTRCVDRGAHSPAGLTTGSPKTAGNHGNLLRVLARGPQ